MVITIEKHAFVARKCRNFLMPTLRIMAYSAQTAASWRDDEDIWEILLTGVELIDHINYERKVVLRLLSKISDLQELQIGATESFAAQCDVAIDNNNLNLVRFQHKLEAHIADFHEKIRVLEYLVPE